MDSLARGTEKKMQNIEKNLADNKIKVRKVSGYTNKQKHTNLYIQTTEWWLSEEKRGGGGQRG